VDVRGPATGDEESGAVPTDQAAGTDDHPEVPERSQLLRALLRTVVTGAVVLVLYYVLPLNGGATVRTVLTLLAGILALGVLFAWQVRAILHSRHPALRAVEAVALSLPLFLLLFAAAYFVLASQDPDSFSEPLSRTDCLYFVVTVFATVGFGDIHPVSEVARLFTTVQMVGDLVVIGVVLRLFVAAVDRGRRRRVGDRAGR
jgi:voltage-gated potassium channel